MLHKHHNHDGDETLFHRALASWARMISCHGVPLMLIEAANADRYRMVMPRASLVGYSVPMPFAVRVNFVGFVAKDMPLAVVGKLNLPDAGVRFTGSPKGINRQTDANK